MSEFCRGGEGNCDCEHFMVKDGDPAHCWECNHGRSKHPEVQSTTPSNTAPSDTAPSGNSATSDPLITIPSNTDAIATQTYTAQRVKTILGNLAAKRPTSSRPEARKEALQMKAKPAAEAMDRGKVSQ